MAKKAVKKKITRKASTKKAAKRGAKPKARTGARKGGGGTVATKMIEFCRGLPGATEDIKWGDNLIFSVGGRMFAGFDTDGTDQFAFKCGDEDFDRLVEVDGVIPAPYAAKFGWVKVLRADALPVKEARALLENAHAIILACLPKTKQEAIRTAAGSAR